VSFDASFQPPAAWRRVRTLEMHTGGEPLRIVVGGFPDLWGETMLDRRRDAMENWDHLRLALMGEPRGHADMYGAIPTAPATEDGDLGVLFLHNAGWSTMCGHGIVALTKAALLCGWVGDGADGDHEVRFDTPAGRVVARARRSRAQVGPVTFRNVASFAVGLDREVEVPALGRSVPYDLAFGGAFYAYVPAAAVGLQLAGSHAEAIIRTGRAIKAAVAAREELVHPGGDSDLEFLYGVIFTTDDQHACVFADGELDRSPTGTGVAGRAALWAAREELAMGEGRSLTSIVGSRFDVRWVEAVTLDGAGAGGGVPAVIPEVTGEAHFTGRGEFWLDPEDPLGAGFFLGRGGAG